MYKIVFIILLTFIYYSNCFAQFTPPGLGDTNDASWFALGIKQKLNSSGNVVSSTHIGLGRISNPDNYNLFQNPSIYVFNEEISNHFKKHWKYSVALSYRWQNQYNTSAPYELDSENARQEIRAYGRLFYLNSLKNIDYSFSFRPEIRFFYNRNFDSYIEDRQFRTRFRGKMTLNLNNFKTHKLITTAEFLLSATREDNNWNKFGYKEARFSLYYAYTLATLNTTFNFGYMNNLLGKSDLQVVHYLAFDIEIKNPF
ncbi:DUF2490 domain-containing protein [Cellulophaga baltica]|uniref:DUF2490 domain-containing protein n=1 Tax=Cellulophaga TaxID=104264 RepID=UPI001C073E4D|nr:MULTISPECIES: DUF2490 domain-containing protein [Cellulophaga]MBU2994856.1 DUF2490 domain-containing protein [Cellulophaga baltica]MDO6766251.1 DUF2490 domain-containing protein [Cellulophaga sp. 1_MG-2023]